MGYSIAALTILIAGIGFEIFRLVVPWPNVAHVLSGAISALLIVVWAAGHQDVMSAAAGDRHHLGDGCLGRHPNPEEPRPN